MSTTTLAGTLEAPRVVEPALTGDGCPILLVDDDAGIRTAFSSYLAHQGFLVDTADCAEDARGMLSSRPYALVLADILMPGMSGLDLLEHVKATQPDVDVIMITGQLDISYAIQAMRRGAYDFFTKPFNFDKILLTIERLRERQRLRRDAESYRVLKQQKEFEDRATLEATLSLARAVEQRDRYNIGHGKRVADYALLIGAALQYAEDRLRRLRYAGLLHDVGKIGIDDRILNKPGSLTPEEYDSVKRHPEIGEYIVRPISFLKELSGPIRHHHEQWNGNGYPDHLSGESIPLDARVIAVADYFDSITSSRPYRGPLPIPEAINVLRNAAAKVLDPMLVDIFLAEIRRSPDIEAEIRERQQA